MTGRNRSTVNIRGHASLLTLQIVHGPSGTDTGAKISGGQHAGHKIVRQHAGQKLIRQHAMVGVSRNGMSGWDISGGISDLAALEDMSR